jgi:hypothetical protein
MAYESAQSYLDIYVDNPDNVCLLYARLDNGAARAIAWTFPDGTRYRDRVYYTSDSARDALLAYATKHHIADRPAHCSIELDIANGENSNWPYMDTFIGMTILTPTRCRLYAGGGAEYELTETDGTCGGDRCCCSSCGDRIDRDNVENYNGDDYCSECFHERSTRCDECGDPVPNENINYLGNPEINVCDHCLEQHYTRCDICGNYRKNEDTWELDTNDANLENACDDCYEDRVRTCAHCGDGFDKYQHGEHLTPDGEPCCGDCFDEKYIKCPTCGTTHSKTVGCEDCDAEHMYNPAVLPRQTVSVGDVPAAHAA